MSDRFLTRSAVMLFLLRSNGGKQEILLQKRQNTGYADGMWECAATGHVDADESMKMAVVRESKEELGIDIETKDVEFATITHKYTSHTKETYYNAFFIATKYTGNPSINEPEKCSEIRWFAVDELPDDLLPDRRQALMNYFSHIPYDESGWASL